MSRVYAIQPARRDDFDLSSAKKFGPLHFVFERGERHPSIWSDEYLHEVMHRLEKKGYDPERDFILLIGPQVPLFRVACSLSSRYHWQALAWNANAREYQSVSL